MLKFIVLVYCFFFFSSRRRNTRCSRDWSSDVCSSDLPVHGPTSRRHSSTRLNPRSFGTHVGEALAHIEVTPACRSMDGTHLPCTGFRQFGRSRSEERRVGKEGRSRWSPDH